MQIVSPSTRVNAPDEKIFILMTNFRQFGDALPAQFQAVETGEDYFQFSFQGLATITLRLTEKQPFSRITYTAENSREIPFSLALEIVGDGQSSDVTVKVDVEVPSFVEGIVKKPLQNFVDKMAEQVKAAAEK